LDSLADLKRESLQQSFEPVIGVDIGPDAIRVVEIERVGREYFLRNFGITPTPRGCMEDGLITDPKTVGRALRELFHKRKFSHRTVVAAVRGSKVASRLITLPAMPHDRLQRLIESEIDRYVLFGSEDKIVYYHPLEEFEEHGRRRVSIMLVIAARDLCYSYYQTLENAGLECAALDVSTFAILRLLRNGMPPVATEDLMSVVYDYQGISMNVFSGDTIRYSRTVKMPALDPMQMQNGFLDKILSEVMLAMHFYQTEHNRGGNLNRMLLSLGAAGGMDLYHVLTEHVDDVPIELHTPFADIKVNVDEFPSELMEQVDMNFLTSVGLAMRGVEIGRLPFSVDLLPTEIAEMAQLRKLALWLCLVLLLIAAATGVMFTRTRAEVVKQQQANARIQKLHNVNQAKIAELEQRAERLKGIPAINGDKKITAPVNTLAMQLSESVPKTMQLLDLDARIQDKSDPQGQRDFAVTINAITQDPASIKDFTDMLGTRFKNVGRSGVEPQQINDMGVNRVTVTARWTSPENSQ